jgi:hypothetical protein
LPPNPNRIAFDFTEKCLFAVKTKSKYVFLVCETYITTHFRRNGAIHKILNVLNNVESRIKIQMGLHSEKMSIYNENWSKIHISLP